MIGRAYLWLERDVVSPPNKVCVGRTKYAGETQTKNYETKTEQKRENRPGGFGRRNRCGLVAQLAVGKTNRRFFHQQREGFP